jgi:hypothetical protein
MRSIDFIRAKSTGLAIVFKRSDHTPVRVVGGMLPRACRKEEGKNKLSTRRRNVTELTTKSEAKQNRVMAGATGQATDQVSRKSNFWHISICTGSD